MSQPSISPTLHAERFNCPRCHAFSHQIWALLETEARVASGANGSSFKRSIGFSDAEGAFVAQGTEIHYGGSSVWPEWYHSLCTSCNASAVWRGSTMVYPAELTAPVAHPSMPDEAGALYEEARATLPVSRRAAAALARACLESLLRHLDTSNKPKRLDEMLASMKSQLGDDLWMLLTALRVVGNDALHGDSDDLVLLFLDSEVDVVIEPLFGAINAIVEKEIAQPARTRALYDLVPERKRQTAEAKADKENPPTGLTL